MITETIEVPPDERERFVGFRYVRMAPMFMDVTSGPLRRIVGTYCSGYKVKGSKDAETWIELYPTLVGDLIHWRQASQIPELAANFSFPVNVNSPVFSS